jgi:two-component system response regulator DevR
VSSFQDRRDSVDSPISVVVIDDHVLIRLALRAALEARERLVVVGEATTAAEGVATCRELRPDVVVLDLMLPDGDGLSVIRTLKHEEGWAGRFLILSGRSDPDAVMAGARSGANGYLDKSAPPEDVAAAVEALAEGGGVFPLNLRRSAYESLLEMARGARVAADTMQRLTPRQRHLLLLLSGSLTTRQIATRLQISERTVEEHLTGLYAALNVRTRNQALYRATQLGLVRFD